MENQKIVLMKEKTDKVLKENNLTSDVINNKMEEIQVILDNNYKANKMIINEFSKTINSLIEENKKLIDAYSELQDEYLKLKEDISEELTKKKETIENANTIIEFAKRIDVSKLPKFPSAPQIK